MKIKIIRIILIILILMWMMVVFGFSNDNAQTSSSISYKVAKVFVKTEKKAKTIEPYVRKLAHLSEYTAGGFLFYGLFLTFQLSPKKQVIFAEGMGVLYAITDEIHQLFVPRKSSEKLMMSVLTQLELHLEYVYCYS